jgi:hypothetical protein
MQEATELAFTVDVQLYILKNRFAKFMFPTIAYVTLRHRLTCFTPEPVTPPSRSKFYMVYL